MNADPNDSRHEPSNQQPLIKPQSADSLIMGTEPNSRTFTDSIIIESQPITLTPIDSQEGLPWWRVLFLKYYTNPDVRPKTMISLIVFLGLLTDIGWYGIGWSKFYVRSQINDPEYHNVWATVLFTVMYEIFLIKTWFDLMVLGNPYDRKL
jgi:hypothetical protein